MHMSCHKVAKGSLLRVGRLSNAKAGVQLILQKHC